jgi:two-component system sensor histidine kinase/response regulator
VAADARAGRPSQVLILEDDASLVMLVTAALKKAGLDVRAANSLEDLDKQLAPGTPDLFILDVNLPDGTGFEACRRLRALPLTAHVPIIFLTRRDEVENRLRAFRLGAHDYVIKPFSVEDLVARVRAHLMLKIQRDQKETQLAELALHERVQIDLMDMVIHDIRTPIATVKLTLAMMAEEGTIDAAQHAKLIEMASHATDAALLMLNDLMDLRVGRVSTELAAFPLSRPLRRAAEILGPGAAKRGISVSVEASPDQARVVSDEKMLLRVILNLLGNAIKFTAKAAPIEMSLRHEGGRLRLVVADRGLGVPAADRERIFEKFQRAGEAALSAPGTGIGLAFCRLAAEALGGRAWAEARPGGGSLFLFEVPAQADLNGGEAAELLGPAAMKTYRADCASQLAALEASLAAASEPLGPELLESVRLAAHRLSGSAGTYGYDEASRVAARLEHRVLESKKTDPGLAPHADEIRLALRDIRRGLDL